MAQSALAKGALALGQTSGLGRQRQSEQEFPSGDEGETLVRARPGLTFRALTGSVRLVIGMPVGAREQVVTP